MAVVYLHRKESDNSIFYVGIGNKKSRANEVRGRNSHWTRVFNKYGRTVEFIRDGISIDLAIELEMFLIQEIGIKNLCNQTLGGEGIIGYKHTEETRLKMSMIQKGRVTSEETKKKISEALMGHDVSEKTRVSASKRMTGNKIWVGRNHNEESKQKVSDANRGKKPTKECLEAATKSKRKKGIVIKELTTGVVFKLYEANDYFDIVKSTISKNSLTDKVLNHIRYTGLNFTRL